MPAQKKPSGKPTLSADFKKKLGERLDQVSVKVGFVNALAIKLSNEQLSAILEGVSQFDLKEYYIIPDQENWGTDLAAVVVQTFGPEDKAFLAQYSEKMKLAMVKQGVPEELIQANHWKVKCEATPTNALLVWMSDAQYEALEYLTTYIFIGILQKQWSVKTGTDKSGNAIYENFDTKPEGQQSFESHTLKLIDFIG